MAGIKIKPEESALLLIDMQNEFLHEKGAFAQMGMWRFAKEAKTIENTKKVISLAHKAEIPVIYVRIVYRPGYPDVGETVLGKAMKDAEACKKGSWGAEIVDELKPTPTDYIIEKRRVSAFYNTDLETLLRSLGRRTLIIAGVVTNFCVEGTVRSAVDRDFDVIALADCTASTTREAQEFAMKNIFPMLGSVATTEELII